MIVRHSRNVIRSINRPCLAKIPGHSINSRMYAVQAPGSPAFEVFNQHSKWLQKERAAENVAASRQVDYLRDEVAFRLCERLLDINRHFPRVLDLGANACNIAKVLTRTPEPDPNGAPTKTLLSHIDTLECAESSSSLLHRDADLGFNSKINMTRTELDYTTERLPWEANTFDAVLSSLSLHWTNDLPSILAQINNVLRPDSPFIGVMLGGDSLYELRTSLQLASMDRLGGLKPHTSPLADVRDVGGLLQKAGFQLLTVDVDDIIIDYPSSFALMNDVQAMGESNALIGREPGGIRRDVLAAAEAIYRELHGNQEDGQIKSVPATFRLIYMIGWKHSPTQAKPLERGTGMFSIKDILEKQGGNIQGSGDGDQGGGSGTMPGGKG